MSDVLVFLGGVTIGFIASFVAAFRFHAWSCGRRVANSHRCMGDICGEWEEREVR